MKNEGREEFIEQYWQHESRKILSAHHPRLYREALNLLEVIKEVGPGLFGLNGGSQVQIESRNRHLNEH